MIQACGIAIGRIAASIGGLGAGPRRIGYSPEVTPEFQRSLGVRYAVCWSYCLLFVTYPRAAQQHAHARCHELTVEQPTAPLCHSSQAELAIATNHIPTHWSP